MSFLIILITLGISFWGLHQTVGTFELVIHTEEASDELLRLFTDLKEAEDQQREYLLTENPQFLEPYHRAVENTKAKTEKALQKCHKSIPFARTCSI